MLNRLLSKECVSRFLLGASLMFLVAAGSSYAGGKGVPADPKNKDANPGVVPVNQKYEGLSYAEWSARWWQWAFSMTYEENPLFDLTGEKAANGQYGDVWFLGGLMFPNDTLPPEGPVTREITVPAGTALFFPIANSENNWVELSKADFPTVESIRKLMAIWNDAQTDDTLYATIDGVPVEHVTGYRTISKVFQMWLPDVPGERNVLQGWGIDFAGWVDPAVSDGFFLMVEPLPVGEHEITFGIIGDGWRMDIVYEITVVE